MACLWGGRPPTLCIARPSPRSPKLHSDLITDLGVVTMVAAVTGMLTRRLGQPSILGYLLAGLIVGPYIPIPLFADPQRMGELAEVGVVLVMFAVGLEFRIRRLLDILPVSGLTAGVQIGALSWAGFTVGGVIGWSTAASVCLGASLAISSTMVVSAVLRSRPVDADVRAHVFGILVVQDVVAIVLMAVVTALAAGETLGLRSVALLVGQLAGVVVLMLVAGLLVLPRLVRFALRQSDVEALVVLVAGAAFGLAMAAHIFGYSVALGAFISGMAVAESGRGHDVEKAIEPLRALFSAIFFVSIGMTVDPLVAWQSLPLGLALCAVVIVMQFFSVMVPTVLTGSSIRRGVYSGLALGQIGELSFILVTIAIAGGVVPKQTLSALVTVATITAFTTPLLLGRAQAIVDVVDHGLPDRAHQVLAAYQSLIRGARAQNRGPNLKRPAIALLLDWSALVVVFVVRHTALPHVEPELIAAVNVGAAVIAAPLLLGVARSGARLASGVRTLARGHAPPTPRTQAVESIALLAVVLGIGLPTLALVQPLLLGHWAEAVLIAALIVVLVILGLRLGRVDSEYTSGVERLAQDLASHVAHDDDPGTLSSGAGTIAPVRGEHTLNAGPLAGLDYHTVAVQAGGPADGRTLAQLDLRSRTGAMVVAITDGAQMTTLPTGHEQLQADDVLAVSGSAAALERAREIIEGPEIQPEAQPKPPQ